MVACTLIGYLLGKGNISIVIDRPVKVDAEMKERIEKQVAEQDRLIEEYNLMVKTLTDYQ